MAIANSPGRLQKRYSLLAGLPALLVALTFAAPAFSQPMSIPGVGPMPAAVKFKVQGPAEKLEMTVNTSRVVEFPFDVPKMLVNNPDLVRITPISPNSIQLSAVKGGVTQLNVWNADDQVTTLDLIVIPDVQELEMILKHEFPDAAIRLRPLASSLYISGFVPKAEMVASITRVAEDYFPKIINNMTVGGVQKVLLHVKVMEVSRTKLRTMGFDWAQLNGDDFVTQSVSGLLQTPGTLTGNTGATVRFGILTDNNQFYGFLEALRQNDLAKLLAEPTLVTMSGRPAYFNVGGEVPIPMQQSLGVTTVQYKQFGTRIDFVPIVLGNGSIRLEVRPEVTEIDPSLRDAVTGVPGFRQRGADTAVEIKAGQTMAIAGLVYNRVEASNRGVPFLADLPWAGGAFRRVSEKVNEVELVIMVTPEFTEALDPSEVPACGPGQLTTSPTDKELYGRGYIEVPKANCNNGNCAPQGSMFQGTQMQRHYEEVPAGPSTPMGSNRRPVAGPQPSQTAQAAQPTPSYRTAQSAPSSPAMSVQPRSVSYGQPTPAPPQVAQPAPAQSVPSYYSGAAPQNPAPVTQPTLIGPLGYDDLK